MRTLRLNHILLMLLCCPLLAVAQATKLNKTYKVNADVTLNVDALHTNVIIENWDRNEVQIEAYLEGEQENGDKTKHLLDSWKLETSGTPGKVTISSGGNKMGHPPLAAMPAAPQMHPSMAKMPEMMEPVMQMMGPLLESISKNPLPPQFMEGMSDLHFDHEAYRKEGEAYMKRWEAKVEKNFGKDFEKSMEAWAANFEKDTMMWKKMEVDMEKWGEEFGKEMEKWGEEFGKEMEVWGEQFGKEMEKWAEQMEAQMEAQNFEGNTKIFVFSENGLKVKRTIRVKMPKDGKLDLNVRHGEVRLSGRSNDLKANFSHSQFSAGTIAGRQTNVKASYTPVRVKQWEYGVLETAYVQNCDIESARSIKITSNSSDVRVGEILETGIISGTFGQLNINRLGKDFKMLDVTLENSDLKLNLPQTALNFNYNGTQSKIKYPSTIQGTPSKSYDSEIINGYHKSQGGSGTVTIKARFSDVVLN